MNWISEAEQLPPIAQHVLLIHPRQAGEFWDMYVAQLLVQYEGVAPRPVPKGSKWPSAYYWQTGRNRDNMLLVTGNSYWALFDGLPLPPGAKHVTDREFHYIAQSDPVWVGQSRP